MIRNNKQKSKIILNQEENPGDLVFKMLEGLNPRTKKIIIKRFGLDGSSKQTLEKIGKNYGITRERVRQIESGTLKEFKNSKKLNYIKPIEKIIESVLQDYGNVMEHKILLERVVERLKNKSIHPAIVEFVLELSDKFDRINESDEIKRGWSLKDSSLDTPLEVTQTFIKILQKKAKPVLEKNVKQEIEGYSLLDNQKNLTPQAVNSYLLLHKRLFKNPFGEWGLKEWSEIVPRGVRDKAYIVLKKHNKPLHFRKITELINQLGFSGKKALEQTVHNELIKDERFVLVGRGIYALKEWGYQPGTVTDVVIWILKQAQKSLSKQEIVDKVLKQRMVNKNTVLLALQNREKFERIDKDLYKLKTQ